MAYSDRDERISRSRTLRRGRANRAAECECADRSSLAAIVGRLIRSRQRAHPLRASRLCRSATAGSIL